VPIAPLADRALGLRERVCNSGHQKSKVSLTSELVG
jgi:hypothetical protein